MEGGTGTSSSRIAQQTFELNNNVSTVDSIYSYDAQAQKAILNARPWKSDPHHFKHVKISAVALIKMVTHARSGGQYEIMGLMQGKIENETFIVMDAFALPVLGTETRVNAGSEGDEYSVQYQSISREVGPVIRVYPECRRAEKSGAGKREGESEREVPLYRSQLREVVAFKHTTAAARSRLDARRTSWDGTTLTLGTDAGSLVSTSQPNSRTRCTSTRSLPS